jgi:hypothetical protein
MREIASLPVTEMHAEARLPVRVSQDNNARRSTSRTALQLRRTTSKGSAKTLKGDQKCASRAKSMTPSMKVTVLIGASTHQAGQARENHDKTSSTLSSAGSGASQSLDGRKKDRDIAIAELKLEEAKLRVLHMDARVGLSRRSRNSSQASSVPSDGQSAMSGSRRSHRRHSPEKEQSLGGALEEVVEVDEEQIVA